jgi:serine protease Do
MSSRFFHTILLLFVIVAMAGLPGPAGAELSQPAAQHLYESTSRSLVVIRYVWESELGRHDILLPGVVVDDHGLVMTSVAIFDTRIPESQMKEIKVLRPMDGQDPREFAATYAGRDDRSGMGFVRVSQPDGLVPLKFIDHSAAVGEPVYAVGLLSESAGFKPYFTTGTVAVVTRGERFAATVNGNLAGSGSPVVDADGNGIGFVQASGSILTAASSEAEPGRAGGANAPFGATGPRSFIPSHEFLDYLHTPPSGADVATPWLGVYQMAGLKKEEAEYYGLKTPGLQLMAVQPGGPAEKVGLEQGQIVIGLNGKPLPRGDTAEQAPQMFRRELMHLRPGATVTLAVLKDKDTPSKDVTVTLATSPPSMATAPRWWNADFGFGVRGLTMLDRFAQHLPPTAGGVIVSVIKPAGPALSAHLQPGQLVSRFNGEPIADVAEFQKKFDAWHSASPHDAMILLVSRDGHDQTIRVELPQ